MDTQLRQYLNGIVSLLSVVAGATLTVLVLPTRRGDEYRRRSPLDRRLRTASRWEVYLAFLRGHPSIPEMEPVE